MPVPIFFAVVCVLASLRKNEDQVARVLVSGGVHQVEGNQPFGVLVYGFGAYTSYMYPGGLDLAVIAPLI